MPEIKATITELHSRQWIDVTFPYEGWIVSAMHEIGGARFVPADKGGPLWRCPLALTTGKALRKAFGESFRPSPALKRWAMQEREVAGALRSLSAGDSADLERVPDLLPELYEAIHLGPIGKTLDDDERKRRMVEEKGSFQTADSMFIARCPYPVNANQPGTGKTLETIAGIFEGGHEKGPKLIIAPLTSLELVWVEELQKWQWQDIILCMGHKQRRQEAIDAALAYIEEGEPFWFITNPATVQYSATYEIDEKTGKKNYHKKKLWSKHPELQEIEWDVVVLDEFHQMGLGNPDTLTARAIYDLKRKKGVGMSGTPIGGKPVKFYGIFKFVDPENFTSKHTFASQWLEVTNTGFGTNYGDVRKEKEKEFWNFVGKYLIRRTKEEVLPWLPPKDHIHLWAELSGYQGKQYKTFAENAELKIEEENLSATSILAEYTRLKQFAISAQRVVTGLPDPPYFKPYPADEPYDSCKMVVLEELLKERGILQTAEKGEEVDTTAQVVIFSQFTAVVNWLYKWLSEKGVRCAMITGAVGAKERTAVARSFQSDKDDRPQVMLMNTKAGGVSITLDNADTVIFMDETWVPDDQEQAEDRIHRASRIHQVTVYFIRTKGTIEEFIYRKTQGKQNINNRILDLRREGLRATATEVA